jgi:hypothetical protein
MMTETMKRLTSTNARLGFHYFPDMDHYTERDLLTWLPELTDLGAAWIVCRADASKAVPEQFLAGLISAGITPILHFTMKVCESPAAADIKPMLEAYVKWGVRHFVFFESPNDRSAWHRSDWSQENLVERFIDRWQPLAELVVSLDCPAIFPPLEPGGSYWDTAFLRQSLESLERRQQNSILRNMILCTNTASFGHSLQWGAGGPERFPEARPYATPEDSEDQLGFRIFDWYQAIAQTVIDEPVRILAFNAGALHPHATSTPQPKPVVELVHEQIVRLLAGQNVYDPGNGQPLAAIPAEVMGCMFAVLADSDSLLAWFQPDGQQSSLRTGFERWITVNENEDLIQEDEPVVASKEPAPMPAHPIKHYMLLPLYEWGVAEWHLEVIKPFVQKHQCTVGFSLEEARYAKRVTVVGSTLTFSDKDLDDLRLQGCQVERIDGNGTSIASMLAER